MAGYARTILLSVDIWLTLALSIAAAVLFDAQTLRAASGLIGGSQAQVGTALLGVVVAGLAILTVFFGP
jgi:hypothetical protein